MADTGVKYPSTVSTQAVNPEDDADWSDLDNIKASNSQYATVPLDMYQYSYRLKAQGFDFSGVPDGATIDGILVRIERHRSSGALDVIYDNRVQLLDASGLLVGDNKAFLNDWPTSDGYHNYGSSSDKWNASPTAAMVKDADFGVVLSVKCPQTAGAAIAYVDYIRMTVYYTPGALEASYNGLAIRLVTDSAEFSGAAKRALIAASSFLGLSVRYITQVAIYSGHGFRYLISAASYAGQAIRLIKKVATYNASARRVILSAASYIAMAHRRLSAAGAYIGQSIRAILTVAVYSGQGLRRMTRLSLYAGQTRRSATALAQYSGSTVRNIISVLVAYFSGQAIRRVQNVASFAGATARAVTLWTAVAEYLGRTLRRIRISRRLLHGRLRNRDIFVQDFSRPSQDEHDRPMDGEHKR